MFSLCVVGRRMKMCKVKAKTANKPEVELANMQRKMILSPLSICCTCCCWWFHQPSIFRFCAISSNFVRDCLWSSRSYCTSSITLPIFLKKDDLDARAIQCSIDLKWFCLCCPSDDRQVSVCVCTDSHRCVAHCVLDQNQLFQVLCIWYAVCGHVR